MTAGVHVDLILTCFFSCKDRASERYRPHREKKKEKFSKLLLEGGQGDNQFGLEPQAGSAPRFSGVKKM